MFGVVRQPVSTPFENLDGDPRTTSSSSQADVLDELSLVDVLAACRPHEVYNLAVALVRAVSWQQPVLTAEFAAVGVTSLLEAIRARRRLDPLLPGVVERDLRRAARGAADARRRRSRPVTPYGVAKAYAHFITRSYRRRYGLHASSGILYNHESPRRPLEFLPRKVAHAAAAI